MLQLCNCFCQLPILGLLQHLPQPRRQLCLQDILATRQQRCTLISDAAAQVKLAAAVIAAAVGWLYRLQRSYCLPLLGCVSQLQRLCEAWQRVHLQLPQLLQIATECQLFEAAWLQLVQVPVMMKYITAAQTIMAVHQGIVAAGRHSAASTGILHH
jgi:hypothetical protein